MRRQDGWACAWTSPVLLDALERARYVPCLGKWASGKGEQGVCVLCAFLEVTSRGGRCTSTPLPTPLPWLPKPPPFSPCGFAGAASPRSAQTRLLRRPSRSGSKGKSNGDDGDGPY